MATTTTQLQVHGNRARTVRTGNPTTGRATGALFTLGGLLMAAGGQLHPRGSGDTVEAHLLSMFHDPAWALAHTVSLIGAVACVVAFAVAWRSHAFDPGVQRWLPAVAVAWAVGAVEQVPHLLAAGEAHALEHHDATPVLDLHIWLQVVATPTIGLSGAFVAVAVARAARSRTSWVLAALGVVGGLLFAASAPLIAVTHDPAYTVLFPFQLGLAIWLIGTGVGLLRR